MLEHDRHSQGILDYLRTLGDEFWADATLPAHLAFAIVVLDRSNRALQQDVGGGICEMVETEPVHVPAYETGQAEELAVVTLYCHTFLDGTGYHYDCVRAAAAAELPHSRDAADLITQ